MKKIFFAGGVVTALLLALGAADSAPKGDRVPVVTPGREVAVSRIIDGVRIYELRAQKIVTEFYPDFNKGGLRAWGYNGKTPGPLIEAVEGEKIQIDFFNDLPEATTVHWHGIELPNRMDGAGKVNSEPVPPGGKFTYAFTPPRPGTFMYHSGTNITKQVNMGLSGMLIVHPRSGSREVEPVDKDFALLLQLWKVPFHANHLDLLEMADYSHFTMNGLAGPAVPDLVVRLGDRVRIRIGNLSELVHPIHLHGFNFNVVGTDGGWIPRSAQWPHSTVLVGGGETRTIEFTVGDSPDRLGLWPLHCHFLHHVMNDMDLAMVPGTKMDMEDHGGMFTRLKVIPRE